MQTKRNVWLWVLYDFANSIIMIVFFLYFAQWLVIDRGVSDFTFNLTFTISTILLLAAAPLAGLFLDKYWRRISGLRYSTVLTVIFYGFCAVSAIYGKVAASLVFFTLAQFAYQFSFTFYTPLLNDIASAKKRGFVSGLGIGANFLGQFAGLALALPFANSNLNFFHAPARAETLLPAVITFFILSLPMLLFFQEPFKQPQKISLAHELKNLGLETKALLSYGSVAVFLGAYFLFNDAIVTASNNFPIFMEQVWKVSDTIKTYILLGIIIASAIGGIVSGYLADRFGHKRTLIFVLCGWVFILPFLGLVRNFSLFIVTAVLMGFWFGANWAVSRSVMAYLAPPNKHNLVFSYFTLAERASSFLGPITWGLIVSNLISLGSLRYRIAAVAVTGFIIIGLFLLYRVQDDRKLEVENH